ncbi:mechanosensitive ion channel family protein [Sphingobacterium sp. SGR-19]|uniref:mechanosensitive ion channel family protein n=1 Tax=Sphingobacterium sp. SGR-19 TaxID=2710886 RepID=UPI0013ECC6BB|nr:mechanosensitive ion channel family protein [Sphingobacterium sp. SGR-19]NGM67061.1 mechanosensitive ion channel family protein [Sphingobacterium sp. SGR-19]
MDNLDFDNVNQYWDNFITAAVAWAPRILIGLISAVLIYLVGSWLIKIIKRIAEKTFQRRNMDISLQRFLLNLIHWALHILLFIVVVSQLGVQTSAFVAMIGAAGLAIGLALQGSLANFAGGILILLLKPFKVGDYISSDTGVSGTVQEIDIFNTKLTTPQNQLVVVPNGPMSNSSITNYTQLGTRRTWFDIRVPYDANLKQAREVLLAVAENNTYAFKEPAPQVVVTELGESAVNLSVRVTTSNDDFWTMNEQLLIDCKAALENAGIEIAVPKRDISIRNEGSNQ